MVLGMREVSPNGEQVSLGCYRNKLVTTASSSSGQEPQRFSAWENPIAFPASDEKLAATIKPKGLGIFLNVSSWISGIVLINTSKRVSDLNNYGLITCIDG